LAGGDEVNFFQLHLTCIYTCIRTVKAKQRDPRRVRGQTFG
jgi:hypothetical protein